VRICLGAALERRHRRKRWMAMEGKGALMPGIGLLSRQREEEERHGKGCR
jgi:hypothetical protein